MTPGAFPVSFLFCAIKQKRVYIILKMGYTENIPNGEINMTIREKAFRRIQNDKDLYRLWNQAKTENERVDLLIQEAYKIGWEEGYY